MRLKVWAVAAAVAVTGCGPPTPPTVSDATEAVAARERERKAAGEKERGAKADGEQPDAKPANPLPLP